MNYRELYNLYNQSKTLSTSTIEPVSPVGQKSQWIELLNHINNWGMYELMTVENVCATFGEDTLSILTYLKNAGIIEYSSITQNEQGKYIYGTPIGDIGNYVINITPKGRYFLKNNL